MASCKKLRLMDQSDFLAKEGYSSTGVCYYLCTYLEEQFWKKGITYDKAQEVIGTIVPNTMINAAKAKNLKEKAGGAHGTVQDVQNHKKRTKPLTNNKLYRMCLWFGLKPKKPKDDDDVNHAVIVFTGAGCKALLYEPNFGFYEVDKEKEADNREVIEAAIAQLYVERNAAYHVKNFYYPGQK